MSGDLPPPEEVAIYIHVPFCKARCPYCHFYVVPGSLKTIQEEHYLTTLIAEWQQRRSLLSGRRIRSLYVGGGTPSLLSERSLERLFELFSLPAGCEVTVEANPEGLSSEQLAALRRVGVNRLSIGVQSFDDRQLKALGRRHTAFRAIEVIEQAASHGFDNLSIDLMYELPEQTPKEWQHSLDQALALPIHHLSLYNLTLEPGTTFFRKKEKLLPKMPGEALSLQLYECAEKSLEAAGWSHYEISAFCRDGKISRHNSCYWDGTPYIGLGPSACSYWEGERLANFASLEQWAALSLSSCLPIAERERLSPEKQQVELLLLGLRRLDIGLSLDRFQKRVGVLSKLLWRQIDEFVQEGLIFLQESALQRSEKQGTLFLTRRGLLCYDALAAEWLVPWR